MYRKIKSILLIALLPLVAVCAPQSHYSALADSLYTAGDYEQAVKAYSAAIDSAGTSSDLYYNLGNAYYRTGHPGRAIVAYERALRLNPRHSDARSNLEFVNSRIVDRPGERGTVLEQAIGALLDLATPNTWAWIAFALFLVTIGCTAMYCFGAAVAVRKIGFFGGIAMLLITCVGIFLAVKASARTTATDMAVVVEPSTILSTMPREPHNRQEEAMLLHEGTKMRILDSLKTAIADSLPQLWLDVEIDNTHRAWINAQAVERI